MSGEDSDLDSKLTALLQTIVARLPNDKKVSSGVVQQLLRGKYADVYPESYIASRQDFISHTLDGFFSQRASGGTQASRANQTSSTTPTATASAAGQAVAVSRHAESSDADESCSDEDEDEESSSSSCIDADADEEESDDKDSHASGGSDSESSVSDDEDDDGSMSSVSCSDTASKEENNNSLHATGPADRKRPRAHRKGEERSGVANGGSDAAVCEGDVLSARCRDMVTCLKKLSHHTRARNTDESAQSYLNDYLIPTFVRHRLDPERYSAKDIRRYRALREVELLQQDGASLQLDRRQRMGRGYRHVELEDIVPSATGRAGDARAATSTTAPTVPYTTPKFLDDEDEDG